MKNKNADENGKHATSKNIPVTSQECSVLRNICQRRISKGATPNLQIITFAMPFRKERKRDGAIHIGGNLLGNSVAMPTAIASSREKLFLNV
jgi:hypothetical protein